MNRNVFFFRVSRYLRYLFAAGNRKGHGIHSPFVFDLVSRVLRNNTSANAVRIVESARKRLMADNRIINVTDLGSGAGEKAKSRKVSSIVRSAAVPRKYGILLANMAAEFGSPLVIEFGTSLGISTMYLAAAEGATAVFSMEGCPETAGIATENFMQAGLENIKLFIGPFENGLTEIMGMGISPGLVFIDGDHRKAPVLWYFERIASISDDKTVVIIDDINYSAGMWEAWNEIRQNEKVTLAIDIFRMGIVFFRKGISYNNYIIRY